MIPNHDRLIPNLPKFTDPFTIMGEDPRRICRLEWFWEVQLPPKLRSSITIPLESWAPVSLEVDEGQSETVQISLMTQPSGEVSVTVTGYAGTDLTPDLQMLTFSQDSYNTPQAVTFTTTEDKDLLNDEVTLTLAASGGGYNEVSHTLVVTIRDNRGVRIEEEESSLSIMLEGNYPNPVSGLTKIVFDLPEPAQISIRVTDLLGRTVQTTPYGWYGARHRSHRRD